MGLASSAPGPPEPLSRARPSAAPGEAAGFALKWLPAQPRPAWGPRLRPALVLRASKPHVQARRPLTSSSRGPRCHGDGHATGGQGLRAPFRCAFRSPITPCGRKVRFHPTVLRGVEHVWAPGQGDLGRVPG
ncbi:hypothetical protein VULLAG_LOCUS802 [Vulpes lagopus]